MKVNEKIKSFFRLWLNVSEANLNSLMITLTDDELRVEQLNNELWYIGMPIRKIHTGLPGLIMGKLADIAVDDMSDVSVEFGGYANSSFEAKIETVGKARTDGIMPIERSVEELYGDGLTKEEKAEEVKRLKIELGYEVSERSTNEFLGDFDSENRKYRCD